MNNKKVTIACLKISFFGIILCFLESCASPRDRSIKNWEKYEWKVVKTEKTDNPTWKISTRRISKTNFYEYKIEGLVHSNPEDCLTAFIQDMLVDADNSKKFPTYTIKKESKDSLLTYVIHNEFFPLKNTEMSVRYVFYNHKDTSMGVRWNEAWEDCLVEPSKKLKRIEAFRGSWQFSPISNNRTNAINNVQFDPKKMPVWLFEPMVFKFLKEGLEDIGNISTK